MTDSTADTPSLGLLNDAELLLVSIDARKRTLRLDCQLEDGKQCYITMHELTEFRCEGLSRQNVVYEIRQSRRGEISDEEVSHWKKWVRGFTDTFNEAAEEQEKRWLDRVRRNEINLVVVESSTGVTLAAVCEKLALNSLS